MAVAAAGLIDAGAARAQPTLTTLYNFTGGYADGGNPRCTLVFDQAGSLYGTSSVFGAGGYVFKLAPPSGGHGYWTETTIYSTVSVGDPPSSLIIDGSGNLYGTASGGYLGSQFYESKAFQLVPTSSGWNPVLMHELAGPTDLPGGLYRDAYDNFYGLSANGGGNGGGLVYQLTPPSNESGWAKTNLYTLPAGSAPRAALVADGGGHFFSTASGSGPSGYGTVFALTYVPAVGWVESVLWEFTGQADGATPVAGLIFDSLGNLYGTTSAGGNGGGSVFELSPGPRHRSFPSRPACRRAAGW
jgi:hypothetical protein